MIVSKEPGIDPMEQPFDDIRSLIGTMPEADHEALAKTCEREALLIKPAGALGRLETMSEWLSAWQGKAPPSVSRPLVAVFAANHGVTEKKISAYPSSVTKQMVAGFGAGIAAINQICIANDLGLKVFDLALDIPTEDFTEKPAMEEAACAATIAFGMEAVAGGIDLLCIGEMGIGNTTSASAIYAALFGGKAEDWVGPGTGIDEATYTRKLAVVKCALELHASYLSDPLEVLRHLGGREIAAMVGAIIAARMQRVPVIIDGFVASAAAAILYSIEPHTLDHCLFGHLSAEPAHRQALQKMDKTPLLDLNMHLGEATGAALAAGIVKAAVQCHVGMATFEEAGISGEIDANQNNS